MQARKPPSEDDALYFRISLAVLGLLTVVLFAMVFVDPGRYLVSNPPLFRLIQAVRIFDQKMFLQPAAKHPLLALLVAVFGAYSVNLYAIANRRFKSPASRFNCLLIAPGVFAGFALCAFGTLRMMGYTADRIGGDRGAAHYAWLIICASSAALCSAGFSYLAIHRPRLSISEIMRSPSVFDLEDLSGAATRKDLRGLLLSLGPQWPEPSANEATGKALKGRICIGRYYDAKTPTNLWVAPEITRMQQTLVVAPPGSGKTYSIALPWSREIPRHGHSVFALDLKGNMREKLSLGAKCSVLYFDPTNHEASLHWNPFSELNLNDPLAFRNGRDSLAEAIFGEVSRGENQFFDLRDLRFIKAGIDLCAYAYENPTLETLYWMFLSQENVASVVLALKARAAKNAQGQAKLTDHHLKCQDAAMADLQALSDLAEQKKYSYSDLSQGVKNKLDPFGHAALAGITDGSFIPVYKQGADGKLAMDENGKPVTDSEIPFHLSDITKRATCFICATPFTLGLMGSSIASVMVRMMQHRMHSRYSKAAKEERQVERLFLILDEFSKLRMSYRQTEDFISTSREAGCVSVIFLQDVNQIREEIRQAILANCLDRYFLRGAGPSTASWCSLALGKRRAPRTSISENASSGSRHHSEGTGTSISEEYVPVLREREIQTTGGLRYGAWVVLNNYSHKPILVNLERPEGHPSPPATYSRWPQWLRR